VTPSWGCVVLTQGQRPDALAAALGSVLRQRGTDVEIVVVGNGWVPTGLPAGVLTAALPVNVGIPAGRNAGVPLVRGELLAFVDDDAQFRDDDALLHLERLFAADATLGLVQPRVIDPDGRPAPRRWVPRLRVGDPGRSSDVTAVWEGVVALRRSSWKAAGGWAGEFFYAHEGIDLAWAVWDAGSRVRYIADVTVLHEANDPGRFPHRDRLSARNRVWLARRRLPWPCNVLYPMVWLVLTGARLRSVSALSDVLRGTAEGLRHAPALRQPMSWQTVWRMTRAGRPPVI